MSSVMARTYKTQRRCDFCKKAFHRLYGPVAIGEFSYTLHSTAEILEAQKNWKDKLDNGMPPTQNTPLTRNEQDGTLYEDQDNIDLE